MQSVEKSTKPCLPKCGRINAKGGTEMINPKISRATLGRAPAYLKFLRGIEDSTANISATTIAKELELGEVQVRKDLRALCGSGKPKTGYKVGELTASLASCLSEKDGGTVIIGAGKLGRALLDYAGFADYGLNILAAFDIAVAEPVASPKVNIFILFQSLILSAANTMQGSASLQFQPKQHSRLATNYTMPE